MADSPGHSLRTSRRVILPMCCTISLIRWQASSVRWIESRLGSSGPRRRAMSSRLPVMTSSGLLISWAAALASSVTERRASAWR